MSKPVIGRIPVDDNRNPVLGGVSNADGATALPAYIDSSTNAVLVKTVSGTSTVSGTYNLTPPTLTNGQSTSLQLDSSGSLKVNPGALNQANDSIQSYTLDGTGNVINSVAGALDVVSVAGTATLTNVASSTSSVTLFGSGVLRKGGSIYNDSTAVLYVAFHTGAASTTNYTVQIAAGGFFELPLPVCQDQINGIWASANGFARVTEMTA